MDLTMDFMMKIQYHNIIYLLYIYNIYIYNIYIIIYKYMYNTCLQCLILCFHDFTKYFFLKIIHKTKIKT